MPDIRNYAVEETLKNGQSATVRAIRPDDKSRLVDAFERLEPRSIYSRFFQHKLELSDAELKRATEVDFENEVALVVTLHQGEREIIIGSGRYVLYATPDAVPSAEIAFIVEEDYHGQGVASRLLRHLTRIAREKGVKRFTAEALSGNRSMLAVFTHCGLPLETKRLDDVVQVTLRLDIATVTS
jgi:GNAT superfamily N-acetyltransferase